MSMKREKIWRKITSAVLSCVFGLSISFVAPVTTTAKPVLESPLISPDSISVSSYKGSVYKTYTAPGANKLIVHIQDAHCNPGVQHNICGILEDLHNNNNIQLIGIEGAKGWINTAILNAIPGENSRKEITRGMVNESIIDGATEFAGNQEEINAALYGVESKELYLNNLRAYKEVAETKKDALAQVELVKGALSNLQGNVLNETLSNLITAKKDFSSNDISYNEYISVLTKTADSNSISLEKYPNIAVAESSFRLEGDIDFDLVDKERTELIDLLSEKMDKGKLEELVTKSLQLRTGKIEASDYYTYLCGMIPKDKDYPNLVKYAEYVKVTAKLNKKDLSNEKTELEKELTNVLAKTPSEKAFVDLTENIYLTEKLFSIKLTRSEFNSYKENSEQAFLAFINEQAQKYNVDFAWDRVNANAWEECQKASLVFYDEALKREDAFVENLVKQMDTDNLSISTLITGGFHTEKIEEIIASKGISYVVIRPTVTERADSEVYSNIMSGLADSIFAHTLAALAALENAISGGQSFTTRDAMLQFLQGQFPGLTIEKLRQALAGDISQYPNLAAALAKIGADKKDFQASLYAQVTEKAFDKDAQGIYAELLAAIKGKYGEDIDELPGDIGIAHWNVRNERIEVSIEALKLFSVLVANGKFTKDEMISFLNTVVMAHEKQHKDNADKTEEKIMVEEAAALKVLGDDLLGRLEKLFNGDYIDQNVGIKYAPDHFYANFIQGVIDKKDHGIIAKTLADSRFKVEALRQIGDLDVSMTGAICTFLDAELFHDARIIGAVDSNGEGKDLQRVRLTDAQITYIQSKGFASVVAEPSITIEEVFKALEEMSDKPVGESLELGRLRAFVAKGPDEKSNRLILTVKGEDSIEKVKETTFLAGLALSQKLAGIFRDQKHPQVQRYELALIPKEGTAERAAFVAMLGAIKKIGGDKVHFQFLGTDGAVVTEPGKDLKLLQTTGEVKDAAYIVITNPTKENESAFKKDGHRYLPVSAMYDAVPVLASAIAGNDDLSQNGNLDSLEPFTRQLFELFYKVGEAKLDVATIKDIVTNPWSSLVLQILSQMPITTADWKAIDLMRRMISIAA